MTDRVRAGLAVFVVAFAGSPDAVAFRPTDPSVLDVLKAQTGFQPEPIEPEGATLSRLAAALAGPERAVRIVLLGDSHVASDYITGMARHRLQQRFGDAGRGLVHADQSARFGGRRLARTRSWRTERIVDSGQAGKTFGLNGRALESTEAGASIRYRLAPEDREVALYFESRPRGPSLVVQTGTVTRRRSTRGPPRRLVEWRLPVDPKRGPLVVRAAGPGVRLFGVAFETGEPGVILEPIGPVGAEARVYLQMDRASFLDHLDRRDPDLVVFMVGGNDALKVRKGWWTLERVEKQLRRLMAVVDESQPEAECLVVTPMDAGRRRDGRVVSRAYIDEVRGILRRVALDSGCAAWDLLRSMGGPGSIARWVDAGIINPHDLLHPRKRAADLIGWGFGEVLIAATSTSPRGRP